MSDVNTTLLLQSLQKKLDKMAEMQGGPSGSDGGSGMDSRIASLESTVKHIDKQVSDIKDDVRRHLWAGISAVAFILAALAASYFRLEDHLSDISKRLYELQISQIQQTQTSRPDREQTRQAY